VQAQQLVMDRTTLGRNTSVDIRDPMQAVSGRPISSGQTGGSCVLNGVVEEVVG
jgi:hypothetical protein